MDYTKLIFLTLCYISSAVSQRRHYYENEVSYFCGNKPADVMFLLDSSNSIWGPDFVRQLDFVRNVTSMFEISSNTTRVGISTFSTFVNTEFNLNDYFNKRALLRAIRRIRSRRGYRTNTAMAIRHMRRSMLLEKNGGRNDPNVAKIGIVLTDGRSRNRVKTIIEAMRVKRLAGVSIFAIGIGKRINEVELKAIASDPDSEYFFNVSNYAALDSIKSALAVRTCKVVPKTTTTTTTTTTSTTTTTTPTTTTTTPTTTTTSILEVARKVCQSGNADVVFAFDSSSNIFRSEFYKQLDFAKNIIENFHIGPNRTRVGAILFSDQIQNIFDLSEYSNVDGMKSALNMVQRSAGGSRIDEALRYIRTKSFRRSIARPGVAQVTIVITGTPTMYLERSKRQATKTREAGISIIPIGIGKVTSDELLAIAGPDGDEKVYQLDSFDDLNDMVGEIALEACNEPEPTIAISDQSCGSRQAADLMFLLDSVNAGRKNTKKALAFVQTLVNDLDVDRSKIQVGLMSAECHDEYTGFQLDSHENKNEVSDSLSQVRGTDFSTILKQMRRGAFSHTKGGRKEAKKVAILIVDGDLDEPMRALTEAQRARIHGIEVFVIQVGKNDPQEELLMMCDAPTKQHFFKVPNYDALQGLQHKIWEALCDEL